VKCANCRKASEKPICDSCWSFAVDQLRAFSKRYHELEDELSPSSGAHGERVSGSKTPPLPVRLETLHLRTGGISTPLIKHEIEMRKMRQETRITWRGEEINRITVTCEYHIKRQQWTYDEYGDIADLATTIISISNKINYVLGHKSEDIVIGSCPTIDEEGKPCNAKLKVNPQMKALEVTCRVCGTVWDSTRWRLLGKMIDA
jgi:hypothetical protein